MKLKDVALAPVKFKDELSISVGTIKFPIGLTDPLTYTLIKAQQVMNVGSPEVSLVVELLHRLIE